MGPLAARDIVAAANAIVPRPESREVHDPKVSGDLWQRGSPTSGAMNPVMSALPKSTHFDIAEHAAISRIHTEESLCRVTARGNDGQTIF
jgi:hypothetical protein